jgi:hypothetical protein
LVDAHDAPVVLRIIEQFLELLISLVKFEHFVTLDHRR